MDSLVCVDELRRLLEYDSATGLFRWRISLSNKGKVGQIAGWTDKRGYINIGIACRDYKAHRLAWLYVHGEWPSGDIDHINGIKSDNRIENIRSVTHAVNGQNIRDARVNNKTGYLGVSPSGSKFKAQITINGKQRNLGRYDTPEEAYRIYLKTKRSNHEGCTL